MVGLGGITSGYWRLCGATCGLARTIRHQIHMVMIWLPHGRRNVIRLLRNRTSVAKTSEVPIAGSLTMGACVK